MASVHPWHNISVGDNQPQVVNAVIEIPKDCTVKYELDKETGLLRLDRYMHSAVYYPADYGFIPQTYCEDNDPLDIFIFTNRPTYPMTLCDAKVIGVLRMIDGGEKDDKILAVHDGDPRYGEWNDIADIPQHFLKELRHFLERYKELQGKDVEVFEVLPKEEAYKDIEQSMKMYKEKFQDNK